MRQNLIGLCLSGVALLACCQGAHGSVWIYVDDAATGIWDVTNQQIVTEGAAGLGDYVEFRASATVCGSQAGVSYYWDFGDGSYDTGSNVFHSYSLGYEGIMAVTLTISAQGAVDVIRQFMLWIVRSVDVTSIGGIAVGQEGALGLRMSFDNACTVVGHVSPVVLQPILDDFLQWDFTDTMLGNISGLTSTANLALPANQWPATSHHPATNVRYWGNENGGATLTCTLDLPIVGTLRLDAKQGVAKYFDPSGMQNGQRNPAWATLAPNMARPNWFQYWTTDSRVRDDFWGQPNGGAKPAIMYANPAVNRPANDYSDVIAGMNKEINLAGLCRWENPPGPGWTCYLFPGAGAGIDTTGGVWQHEERHRLDFVVIWPNGHVALVDGDNDFLHDGFEPFLNPDVNLNTIVDTPDRFPNPVVLPVIAGIAAPPNVAPAGWNPLVGPRPYNPTLYGTDPSNPDIWNYGESPLRDCEDYCELWLLKWIAGCATAWDWSHPGSQW